MTVRGFTIDPDGKRIPMDYCSPSERAWCECAELTDAGFFKEALDKFGEYFEEREVSISNSRDTMLLARIQVGLAKETGDKEDFDRAIETIIRAMCQDSGGFFDKIAEIMEDIVEAQIKELIPVENDYEKAPTKSLLRVADSVLQLLDAAVENDMWLATISDHLFNTMHDIVDALLDQKKTQEVGPIVEKLLQVDQTNLYQDIADEWKEKLQ